MRTTQQKHIVLNIIKRVDGHLDADEIFQRARESSPNISLSTVYRNLHFFKKKRLVKEHKFDKLRSVYERISHSYHHHMLCVSCGQVFEFTCTSTEKMKSRLAKEKGFKVTDVDVCLMGYCPECQQYMKQEMTIQGGD